MGVLLNVIIINKNKIKKTLYKPVFLWYNDITVYLEQGVSSRITLFYVGGNIL